MLRSVWSGVPATSTSQALVIFLLITVVGTVVVDLVINFVGVHGQVSSSLQGVPFALAMLFAIFSRRKPKQRKALDR
jgi:uncharacterized membrane-anchored protein